jgi:hypothetical protein
MKTLLFAAWLLYGPPPSPSPSPAPSRVIVGQGVMVKISFDGTVWRSPTTTLDAASLAFWEFVGEHNPMKAELEQLRAENAKLRKQCGRSCK